MRELRAEGCEIMYIGSRRVRQPFGFCEGLCRFSFDLQMQTGRELTLKLTRLISPVWQYGIVVFERVDYRQGNQNYVV